MREPVRGRISSRGEGIGLSAKSLCVIGLKFVVFAFIALLVVTPRLGAATPNLVAAYGFDEGSGVSVADSSGNGLTGAVANGSWSAAGKFGKALSFNGTSSRVTVPDAAALDLTTGMTLEAWVNPAVAPTGWKDVIYKGNDNYYLEASSSGGNRPVGGAIIGGSQSQAFGTAQLATGAWVHLAETYDGAALRFYLNGTQVSSVARTGSILTSTNALNIGSDSIYGQYFNGLIDEVRIYNVALSATQIQTDMATAIGGGAPPADTTPPTDPSALSATAAGTTVNLSWTGSTDAGGVTGYEVERCQGAGCSNFTPLKTVTTTTTSDTGLAASTSYSYRVRAKDAVPNFSGYSNTATATTAAATDTTPPTDPSALSATAAGTTVNLSWTGSTDAGGVTGYEVERCQGAGCSNFTPLKTVTTTTTSDTGLAASTSYSYRVRAKDAVPNFSGYSNTATATTAGSGGTPGLVAAYGFDEGSGVSVADSSGNGLTGAVANGSWSAAGKFGKALSFNGTSSRVTVPDAAALDLTTGMTLEAWVNPAVAPTGWKDVIYKGNDNYYLEASSSGGNRPVGGAIIGGSQSQAFGTAQLATGAWVHLAETYDGAALRFYLNGTQVSSVARTGSILTSTNALNIGSDSIYGQYFNGLIDEVRIYNVALSATQIQTDMATAIGGGAPPADTTPPTDPSALSATAAGTTVNLSWTGSTDAGGVTGYEVERCQGAGCSNFTPLKTVTTTTTSDTGLAASTSYSYRVRAKDAVPNFSGYSNTATATTAAATDTTPPTDPSALSATAAGTTVNLSWTGSTDAGGVTGYEVERCQGAGCSNFTPLKTVTTTTTSDTGLAASTSYSYRVRAKDAVPNFSGYSNTATATTAGSGGTPGLVAAYGFDEGSGVSVADSSGNGLTGAVANGSWSAAGKFGKALSFNGTSSRVTVPDAAALDLTTGMTLEAWVNPAVAPTGWKDVIYKGNDNYYLEASSSGGNRPVGGAIIGGSQSQAFGTAQLATGAWVHLAETYDGAALRFYLNGTQVSSVARTGSILTSTNALNIGSDSIYGQYFNGLIDEVRIYNVALSATQIQTDMATSITGAQGPPTGPPAVGSWAQPVSSPIVPIHTTELTNGKLLIFDSDTNSLSNPRVFDPVANTFTQVPYNNVADLFCAGHAPLPDGRVLVAGGHNGGYIGIKNTTIFNPANNSWTDVGDMQYPRWYPTLTKLPDGRMLVVSGSTNCPECLNPNVAHPNIATVPEIFNPATNAWTSLPSASLNLPLYPHMYVLPDGRVFAAATQEDAIQSQVLNLSTNTWSPVGSGVVDGGSSVEYAPGKILKSGTAWNPDYPAKNAAATAYVIDMNQASPNWRQVASMAFPRTQHQLTMLPDGTVLATGGSRNSNVNDRSTAVLAAELWNPATETWTTLSSGSVPRMYHSSATLIPDGRIILGGGGHPNTFGIPEYRYEAYSPPYLFKGARPTISSAPASVNYGQTFTVSTPDASTISKVSLIPQPAPTHAYNMNAGFNSLSFTQTSGGINVTAPANANLATPGYYMLFIVNSSGVPSVASWIHLPAGGGASPTSLAGVTPPTLTTLSLNPRNSFNTWAQTTFATTPSSSATPAHQAGYGPEAASHSFLHTRTITTKNGTYTIVSNPYQDLYCILNGKRVPIPASLRRASAARVPSSGGP